MAEKLNKAPTYIVLILIVGIFIFLINQFMLDVSNSSGSQLSTNSQQYISQVTGNPSDLGFDTSVYNESTANPLSGGGTDNKNEFALDFIFGQRAGNRITRFLQIALGIPEFILVDLLRFPDNNIKWFYTLLNWSLNIFVFIAIVYFIRNR